MAVMRPSRLVSTAPALLAVAVAGILLVSWQAVQHGAVPAELKATAQDADDAQARLEPVKRISIFDQWTAPNKPAQEDFETENPSYAYVKPYVTTGRKYDVHTNILLTAQCTSKCQPRPGYNPSVDVVASCMKFCAKLSNANDPVAVTPQPKTRGWWRRGAVTAQTLQSIVKAAVSNALKAREAAEKGQEQAGTAVPGQSNIVWATAVPVTSNSPKSIRMSAASAQPVAAATDFAAPTVGASPQSAPQSSADTVAMVKKMSEKYESWKAAKKQARAATERHEQQQEAAAVSAADAGYGNDEATALRREKSALLNEEATTKPRDALMEDTEAEEIAKLKSEVQKMQEQERVQRLKRQVDRLKRHLRRKGYHNNPSGLPMHSLASADDDADAGGAGDGDDAAAGGGGDADKDDKSSEDTPKLPEYRKMKVCDGLGCHMQAVAPAAPPHADKPKTMEQQLEGASLTDLLWPDPKTWEPEVHLNAKGQIRADHDDPHGLC
jgi:hypothetical protein